MSQLHGKWDSAIEQRNVDVTVNVIADVEGCAPQGFLWLLCACRGSDRTTAPPCYRNTYRTTFIFAFRPLLGFDLGLEVDGRVWPAATKSGELAGSRHQDLSG